MSIFSRGSQCSRRGESNSRHRILGRRAGRIHSGGRLQPAGLRPPVPCNQNGVLRRFEFALHNAEIAKPPARKTVDTPPQDRRRGVQQQRMQRTAQQIEQAAIVTRERTLQPKHIGCTIAG